VAQASEVEAWHTLVHVCRRWRNLVFASPRRLNLRIACTNETPVREKLDIWPPLPIVISGGFDPTIATNCDNIKAALEHHDRVCQITLFFHFCELEDTDIVASLEEPFPILTDLALSAPFSLRPFDPDSSKFLAGSPHLRSLTLSGIQEIPQLLKLLLSTPNLVILCVDGILNFRYESFLPGEMVTALSALTRLEQLDLHVGRSYQKLENRCLSPLTPTALPSLTRLKIRGNIEYVEDFMAWIDAPLLDHLFIFLSFSYFDRDIALDTPQLIRFISRMPKLQAPVEENIGPVRALIGLGTGKFEIKFSFSTRISFRMLGLEISCRKPERQFSCLAWFCRSAPFPLRTLERLFIGDGQNSQQLQGHHTVTENNRWLEVLRPFVAVKRLYLTKKFTLHIAHALQELVGERVMEVLPVLENILIEEFQPSGPVYEVIREFVAARQLAGHSIIISNLDVEKRRALARRRQLIQ
jgi:hypothetical protein